MDPRYQQPAAPMPAPAAMPPVQQQARPPVGPTEPRQPLAPVTLWRGVIVFAALYGLYGVMAGFGMAPQWDALRELSQLASLVVAICYLGLMMFPLFTGGRRHEPRSSWLRGALAVMMLLVCLTSIFVLGNGGQLSHQGFFFEHLVTPVLVVLDFLFVGRGQLRTAWWHPLTWVSFPLAYFVFMQFAGVYYGPLFDPAGPTFVLNVAAFVVAVIVFGYILYALTKLVGLAVGRPPGPVTAAPLPVPPAAPAPHAPTHPGTGWPQR